jgi:lysophospholipase L1-like esterase
VPLPGRRIAGFRLRNLNYALGVLAGPGGWAVEDELLRIDALARACKQRGIPLFVLGPTPTVFSWWSSRVTRRANDAIRRRLAATGVPYALIEGATDGSGRPLVRADGFHLTPDGHRFVAERLYDGGMRQWAGDTLGRP